MSATVAALVLAWMAIGVLALALAGTLRQLRDVQAALVELGGRLGRQRAPEAVRPAVSDRAAVVLLVDQLCVACSAVVEAFVEIAVEIEVTGGPAAVDAVVLTHSDDERWDPVRASPATRLVVDRAAYHRLDPGWRPAVLSVDADGTVRSAVPAGSREALRDAVLAITDRVSGRN